ncbi:hypothetical protein [Microbacterium pygmaeum]|uniref:Uncharacterized protein n=1 Tax=Microbacterium pygmaeum TaxID=370764 RepID=A0A1G7VMW5_9MICO|nr:hypothetical protein [Microbacterium pygmaeum]SDG61162.1 hypothetical protein SAMN04489810_0768 [Microbacterium pygmaeum]
MRIYVDRLTAVLHPSPRSAPMAPRRERPRRARATFVPLRRELVPAR